MIQKSPQAVCLRDFSMTHYCVINYLFVTFRRSVSKFGRPYGRLFVLPGFPYRVRASSLGVYLLFALSSLRERLSCSLHLSPLPLYGYPCGLLPPLSCSFNSPSRYSCTQRIDKALVRPYVLICKTPPIEQ